jgi:inner membrane protein
MRSFAVMDSLSQIVLGAATAEVIAGRKVGNRAILWGAIAGTIPDLDILVRPFVDELTGMAWHRGFSHSLVFFFLFAPVLGWLISKMYRSKWGSARLWTITVFFTFFTHALLDCFTSWGTQLFWPLPKRIAWHTIFVADPLYTVPFLILVIVTLFIKRTNPKRQWVMWTGIALSSSYLALTVVHKSIANDHFEALLDDRSIEAEYYESRNTPLNSILWTLNAKSGNGYYVSYYSLLDSDSAAKAADVYFVEQNDSLLDPYRPSEDIDLLLYLTQGYYQVLPADTGVLVCDMRFGTPVGIDGGPSDFVFGFNIRRFNGEIEIKQTPRPNPDGEMAKRTISQLWERLKGI